MFYGMTKKRFALAVAAVLGMLATFLPWVKISGLAAMVRSSVNGTEGDGWITLVLFAVVLGLVVFMGDRAKPLTGWYRYVPLAVGAINLIIGLYDLGQLSAAAEKMGRYGSATPGFGIWLLILMAIAMIVIPFVMKETETAA